MEKTLRDEFAMAIAIGLLSNKDANSYFCGNYEAVCFEAYRIADAMMKQREE